MYNVVLKINDVMFSWLVKKEYICKVKDEASFPTSVEISIQIKG